ncbi:unnamed protein product, partial [Urochloa humidicola]
SDDLPNDSPVPRGAGSGGRGRRGRRGTGPRARTVETMGEEAAGAWRGSLERVGEMFRQQHLEPQRSGGRLRESTLPAHEFCKQGFVLGKASEAGVGNELYKILTAGALSAMLNESLIIGQ